MTAGRAACSSPEPTPASARPRSPAACSGYAQRRGLRPIPFKPVETGCDPDPLDARALWRAAGSPIPRWPRSAPTRSGCRRPPRWRPRAEGSASTSTSSSTARRRPGRRGDFLLVEGAGGLLVPYADGVDRPPTSPPGSGSPCSSSRAPRLGTVNHTALTLREARRAGLPVAGVVLNQTTASAGPHEAANAELIAALTGLRAARIASATCRPRPRRSRPARGRPRRALDPGDLARLLGVAGARRSVDALGLTPTIGGTLRVDDDPAEQPFAVGLGRDARMIGQGHVNDPPIVRAHRLDRHGSAAS